MKLEEEYLRHSISVGFCVLVTWQTLKNIVY